MIRPTRRIWEAMNRFLWKSNWFFLDFSFDMAKKQSIINLNRDSSKNYTSAILRDSEVDFLREE